MARVSFAVLVLLSNLFAAVENSSTMVFLSYPLADRRSANCWGLLFLYFGANSGGGFRKRCSLIRLVGVQSLVVCTGGDSLVSGMFWCIGFRRC